MLDEQNNLKIIDFSFSTCIPFDYKVKIFCSNPSYMACETVNKTEHCGPPADDCSDYVKKQPFDFHFI